MSRPLLLWLFLLVFAPVHGAVLPAQISTDTTLALAQSPYDLSTSLSIDPGVTVTVEPGVEIVATGDFRVFVNGTLTGGGPALPIIFRASDALSRGAWEGIYVAATGHLRLTNATISNGVYGIMAPGGEVSLTGCRLTLASEDALWAWGACVLDCSGCEFSGATKRGVTLEGYQVTGLISGSRFADNGSYPAQVKAPLVDVLASDNTFVGNAIQRVGVSCSLAEDITGVETWPALALPLALGAGGGDQTLTIAAGGQLTIGAGSTLYSGRIDCRGRLDVAGTATRPVLLTAPPEAATPGGWEGVFCTAGSTCTMSYATVELASTGLTADGAGVTLQNVAFERCESDGARVTGASTIAFRDTVFRNNGRCGLRLEGPGTTGSVQDCDFLAGQSYPVWALAQKLRCLGTGNAYAGNGISRIGVSCGGTPDLASGDHVWVRQDLPLDCTVAAGGAVLSVGSGAGLTIQGPQVVHSAGVDVSGRLTVAASAAEPCLFLPPPGSSAPGSWNGLRFIGGSGSLRGAVVRYGANGLSLASASPTVAECTFCNSEYDGLFCTGTSAPVVTRSAFVGNARYGVNVLGTAQPNLGNIGNVAVDDDGRNELRGNGGYEIYNGTVGEVRAQNCTWVSTSDSVVATRIYDRWDDSSRGMVVYQPLRAGPPSGPMLNWCGDPGYVTDGVEPDVLAPTAAARFRVKYSDPAGAAPQFVRLHVLQGGASVTGSPFAMSLTGAAAYATGAVYGVDLTLPTGRTLCYWFAAGAATTVTGPATIMTSGPVVSTAPGLTFSPESGYGSDGVAPNAGPVGTPFVFRCIYTDADNDEPTAVRCAIQRNGVPISGSPFDMTPRSAAACVDGRGYEVTCALAAAGTYSVRFESDDGVGAAGGPATVARTGPVVSATGPAVAGLNALQTAPAAVQISWRQNAAATVSIDIVNLAGRTVARACRNVPYGAGEATAEWPRRLSGGALAPAGAYMIALEAAADDGTRWRIVTPLRLR